MIYYQYDKGFQKLDPNGAYFMPDDVQYASHLMSNGLFSNEVNIINYFRDDFMGSEDKVFVDIGANVGTYSIVLGHKFKHVYAFEPNKHIYNILCGNIALHNLSEKSTLVNIGLSDTNNVLTYKFVDKTGGNNMFVDKDDTLSRQYDWYHDDYTHEEQLPVRPLDDFHIDNIGLVKIDVEGFELNVLKGAVETLKNSNNPPIILESWNVSDNDTQDVKMAKEKLRNDLFGFLGSLGYTINHFENDVFYCF